MRDAGWQSVVSDGPFRTGVRGLGSRTCLLCTPAVKRFCIISGAFSRLFFYGPVSIIHAMKAQTAQLNGIEMYYEMEGSGDPLLLLHGGTGCHDDWVYAGRDQLVSEHMLIR